MFFEENFEYFCLNPKLLIMTNEAYHSDTSHISKSGLDLIAKSPLHYWDKYLNPKSLKKEETPAMFLGTAVHTAVLEPDKFDSEYLTLEDSQIIAQIGGKSPKATKKYKEWLAEITLQNAGKLILSSEQSETVKRISESVRAHGFAAELLQDGIAEQSFFFKDWETNAPCKIRPDWLSHYDLACDLKTTDDASPSAFMRSIVKYRYYVQAPFYLDGLEVAQSRKFSDFVFIAVEKTPPYAVACYVLDKDTLQLGRSEYRRNLAVYMDCLKSGNWHGFSQEIEELRLPKYKFYES